MSIAGRAMPAKKSPGSGWNFTGNSHSPAARRQHLDFGLRQLAVLFDRKIADAQASDLGPNQLEHLATDSLDHPVHLSIPAFANCYFDERIFGGITHSLHHGRLRGAVAQDHAFL